ncbi:unnamed protein product [Adineta steineri]|uniref:Archaemetzincin-2 n=1 Tax=Adineta steineri TaxID=433720 RepID=A0A819J8K0_9BILA|nr:unnamed protein product [Adineta steineri]CAF0948366.1 unnamed protein product [Adineta steineri]CAF3680495.1 unnamed protein product [Adineta steineri]CAF3929126.1 unnamed protein product [Adineta steineri]
MSIKHGKKIIPYADGFKVPQQSDIKKALGTFDDNSLNTIFTERFYETFDSLPFPKKPWDWLAQYVEKGQTYAQHLQLSRTLHTSASSHRNTIYLTIFGQIDKTIFDVDSLIDYTQRFFQIPVKLINPFIDVQWNNETNQWTCILNLSNGKNRSFKLQTRYNENHNHSQISVRKILDLLTKVVPMDARCLVALTMYDLYDDNTDLFIAGLARGNNRVAAFSLYRYDPYLIFNESNWFDCKMKVVSELEKEIEERRNLLLLRTCRLLTHEVCHLFGIEHCIYYSCLMNGSGHLDEDFTQPLLECPIELRKLHIFLKFNINKRYEELLDFFQIHNFYDEIKMTKKKLDVINQPPQEINSSVKRKRLCNVTTNDEDVSQPSTKHFKDE